MSNGDSTPKPAPVTSEGGGGYLGSAGTYGEGGYFGKTKESMEEGAALAQKTAESQQAAVGAIGQAAAGQVSALGAAAAKQKGVIQEAHRNALVEARQELARRSMQGMKRGRSTGGNIQAAGTLGKQAAQEYKSMATQQAQDIGAVEHYTAEQIAGIEAEATRQQAAATVLANQAWETANQAYQDLYSGMSLMDTNAEQNFKNQLDAWLTNIGNASTSAGGGSAGFDEAYIQAGAYFSTLDPTIVQHATAAEWMLLETLGQSPDAVGFPVEVVRQNIKGFFDVFGLQGGLEQAVAVVKWLEQALSVPIPGHPDDGAVSPTPQTWDYIFKYMINNNLQVNELPDIWWDEGADGWRFGVPPSGVEVGGFTPLDPAEG